MTEYQRDALPGFGLGTLAIHAGQSPDPSTGARGHDTDLCDLELRAVESRRASGLRVLPYPQPHPFRYERCVVARELVSTTI